MLHPEPHGYVLHHAGFGTLRVAASVRRLAQLSQIGYRPWAANRQADSPMSTTSLMTTLIRRPPIGLECILRCTLYNMHCDEALGVPVLHMLLIPRYAMLVVSIVILDACPHIIRVDRHCCRGPNPGRRD